MTENLSFEEAFAQLEQAVTALETGNLPLDRAIEVFETGMRLAATCTTCLDKAELRLKQLVPVGEAGLEVIPWEPRDPQA